MESLLKKPTRYRNTTTAPKTRTPIGQPSNLKRLIEEATEKSAEKAVLLAVKELSAPPAGPSL